MTLITRAQANPDEQLHEEVPEIVQKVRDTVKALDNHAPQIHRWFWKALLAFNLVLWSVALCVAALRAVA